MDISAEIATSWSPISVVSSVLQIETIHKQLNYLMHLNICTKLNCRIVELKVIILKIDLEPYPGLERMAGIINSSKAESAR